MITSDHNPIDIEHKKNGIDGAKMEQLVWKALLCFDERLHRNCNR
jgi:hypothetical protein